jgi:hypothetical protein
MPNRRPPVSQAKSGKRIVPTEISMHTLAPTGEAGCSSSTQLELPIALARRLA